jgi:hypothetical protein
VADHGERLIRVTSGIYGPPSSPMDEIGVDGIAAVGAFGGLATDSRLLAVRALIMIEQPFDLLTHRNAALRAGGMKVLDIPLAPAGRAMIVRHHDYGSVDQIAMRS